MYTRCSVICLWLVSFLILSIPLALCYHTKKVLLVIATKGCAITQHDPNNIKLTIGVVFTMNIDEIAGYQLMHIIYAHVPIIRSLCATNGYYERTTINMCTEDYKRSSRPQILVTNMLLFALIIHLTREVVNCTYT